MIGQEYDFTRPHESALAIAFGKGRHTKSAPAGKLSLSFADGLCAGRTGLYLTKQVTLIGRDEAADIMLEGETVSRHHCEITRWGAIYVLRDNSRNGTFVNGHRVRQVQLHDGDQLRVGQNILLVHLTSGVNTSLLAKRATAADHLPPILEFAPHIVIKGLEDGVTQTFDEERITLGRRPGNQVTLEADNISRQHAAIERREGQYYICDLGSANGTFLNDQRTDIAALNDGDRVRIGNFTLQIGLREQDCVLTFKQLTR